MTKSLLGLQNKAKKYKVHIIVEYMVKSHTYQY